MKLRIFLLCAIILPGLLPTLVSAEIYKWRDTNGVIRYSDVPPPSNVKQEPMSGKKSAKPTGQAPLAAVEGDATVAMNKDKMCIRDSLNGASFNNSFSDVHFLTF